MKYISSYTFYGLFDSRLILLHEIARKFQLIYIGREKHFDQNTNIFFTEPSTATVSNTRTEEQQGSGSAINLAQGSLEVAGRFPRPTAREIKLGSAHPKGMRGAPPAGAGISLSTVSSKRSD